MLRLAKATAILSDSSSGKTVSRRWGVGLRIEDAAEDGLVDWVSVRGEPSLDFRFLAPTVRCSGGMALRNSV